jgi:hypothetical protein
MNEVTKEALAELVARFVDASFDAKISEREQDAMLYHIEKIVPNSRIYELIISGEIDRTSLEIAEEALYRESLWKKGGDIAVLMHVQTALQMALKQGVEEDWRLHYIHEELKDLAERIPKLMDSNPH